MTIELTIEDRAAIANMAIVDAAQYAYTAGIRAGLRRAATECDRIATGCQTEVAIGANQCAEAIKAMARDEADRHLR
jgi:hypothetical protein